MTATERELPPSWDGSVVLDIGGEIGALVLICPAELNDAEIDLSPDTPGAANIHSAVRLRELPGGECYAAVYPQLPADTYTVVGASLRVEINGGRVTEAILESDQGLVGHGDAVDGHVHVGHIHPHHH